MDRTLEFNTATESARVKLNNQNLNGKSNHNKRNNPKSEFTVSAAKIGKEISETSDKLAKLTKLAKMKTIFNDPAAEIEELTSIIKQNIQNLNKDIVSLREISKGGNSNGGYNNSNNNQKSAHSDTVITYLNSKLASTTKDFKEVLQIRTENLKTQQERRQRLTGTSVSASSLPNRAHSESALYKTHIDSLPESPPRMGDDVIINMPLMTIQRQQDDYTLSRATAVENIERTIVELSSIFQQLATLVSEQGDMIQRIDADIEHSAARVEAGNTALLKYLKNISGSRMLIVKLFLVLIVFAVIFIVFFV